MEISAAIRSKRAQARPLTDQVLEGENDRFRGKGGVSAETACCGFRPGFLDTATGTIYLSRFADGTPAPIHILGGLPAEVVAARDANGRVLQLRSSVISGFVQCGHFYTREEAARQLSALGGNSQPSARQ